MDKWNISFDHHKTGYRIVQFKQMQVVQKSSPFPSVDFLNIFWSISNYTTFAKSLVAVIFCQDRVANLDGVSGYKRF